MDLHTAARVPRMKVLYRLRLAQSRLKPTITQKHRKCHQGSCCQDFSGSGLRNAAGDGGQQDPSDATLMVGWLAVWRVEVEAARRSSAGAAYSSAYLPDPSDGLL